jgi:hypothetical protein
LTETVKLVFDVLAMKLPVGERVSQVLLQEVPGDTWVVALILVWAVTVRVCEAGATPPETPMNVRVEGLKVRPDAVGAVTFRVTVADCATTPPTLREIVPVHVVPAVSPDGLTEIVKLVFNVLAMKLPFGERVSQVLLQAEPGNAWAFALVLVWAVTVRICEAGATPPATAVNVKALELKVRVVAAAVTVRVTLKTSDPWLEVI